MDSIALMHFYSTEYFGQIDYIWVCIPYHSLINQFSTGYGFEFLYLRTCVIRT